MIWKIWVSSDNRSLGELSELCHIIMFYVYRMLRTSPQRNNVIKNFLHDTDALVRVRGHFRSQKESDKSSIQMII